MSLNVTKLIRVTPIDGSPLSSMGEENLNASFKFAQTTKRDDVAVQDRITPTHPHTHLSDSEYYERTNGGSLGAFRRTKWKRSIYTGTSYANLKEQWSGQSEQRL